MRRFGVSDLVVLTAIAAGAATARLLEGPGWRCALVVGLLYGLTAAVSVAHLVRRWREVWGAGRVEF